ncbi:MAG: class I SAM-dependent methyltransferase [Rhodothermales bacterium]
MFRLIARHLRTPDGLFGRLIARLMNVGNRPMNRATLEALGLEAGHRVLEIGFGGASLFDELLRRTPEGAVAGLELSDTMRHRAERQFRLAIEQGRLDLKRGSVEAIPFGDASFDRAFTVNTIYFWSDPERAARELARVLTPGGRLCIAYGRVEDLQRLPPTQYGFRLWERDEVESLLRGAGFEAIESDETVDARRSFILTSATAPDRE